MASNYDLPDVGLPPTSSDRTLGASVASFDPSLYDDGTFHHEGSMANSVDDFSHRTHDQLPALEQYKASHHHDNGGAGRTTSSRRTLKIVLATALTIVLAALLITVGVVAGRNGSASDKSSTKGGRGHKCDSYEGRECRVEKVVAFVSNIAGWSDTITMVDMNSPQYKAAKWIADLDPKNMEIEESEDFKTRYALTVFYYAMKGESWEYKVNWLSAQHVCLWEKDFPGASTKPVKVGVGCDVGSKTVRSIFLPSMDLNGQIPNELGLLTGLQKLDLYNNDIVGKIPVALKNLKELETLVLHHNFLTGSIPGWFNQLPALQTVDLAINKLSGGLPSNLGGLSSLSTLSLEHNFLTGSLEPLDGLHNVKLLALGDNKLSGGLSSNLLSSWRRITDLDVSDNNLTGSLPDLLFAMDHLITIDLHGNSFEGHLPTLLELDSTVEFLALHENNLTGRMDEVAILDRLRHLDLSNNSFEGTMPASFADLTDLKYLYLAFNEKLTAGAIPVQWASLTKLVDFSLQKTNRNGTIPGELGLFQSMVLLDLADNALSGQIPPQLGSLAKLKFLILKDNKLTGSIPATFAKLKDLDTIVIDNNSLNGGALNICTPKLPDLQEFISDCKEVDCLCCTLCCVDGDPACNNVPWFSSLDPVANYQYMRVAYKFNEKDIIYPIPGQEELSDNYDNFGLPGGGI